ncbi:hypothetical protein GCM10023148_42120 [Actinokineospora soli]
MTQMTWFNVASSPVRIAGIATVTMVESNITMKKQAHRAANPTHGRSRMPAPPTRGKRRWRAGQR